MIPLIGDSKSDFKVREPRLEETKTIRGEGDLESRGMKVSVTTVAPKTLTLYVTSNRSRRGSAVSLSDEMPALLIKTSSLPNLEVTKSAAAWMLELRDTSRVTDSIVWPWL